MQFKRIVVIIAHEFNNSKEFIKLFEMIFLMQYISLVGIKEISKFIEIDDKYKEDEIHQVTSKVINETNLMGYIEREDALKRVRILKV